MMRLQLLGFHHGLRHRSFCMIMLQALQRTPSCPVDRPIFPLSNVELLKEDEDMEDPLVSPELVRLLSEIRAQASPACPYDR
jgi:hypothetical protein